MATITLTPLFMALNMLGIRQLSLWKYDVNMNGEESNKEEEKKLLG